MREILFRGKRIDSGEWVEGGTVHQTDFYGDSVDRYFIIDGTDTDDNIGPAYRVHPDTVGQYTGLTDKNGKKIFEGDILKEYGNPPERSLMVIKNGGFGCFIEFYFGGEKCGIEQIRNVGWLSYAEVIGNIYDNSELLEVTK